MKHTLTLLSCLCLVASCTSNVKRHQLENIGISISIPADWSRNDIFTNQPQIVRSANFENKKHFASCSVGLLPPYSRITSLTDLAAYIKESDYGIKQADHSPHSGIVDNTLLDAEFIDEMWMSTKDGAPMVRFRSKKSEGRVVILNYDYWIYSTNGSLQVMCSSLQSPTNELVQIVEAGHDYANLRDAEKYFDRIARSIKLE